MGPTTIDGLPAHILLVHFVVVFVPLTALALLLSVLWPDARRRLGFVTPLLALVTLVLVPMTTHAGEALIHSTPSVSATLHRHAHLGDQVIYWSAAVFVIALSWWLQHHERVLAWSGARGGVPALVTGRWANALLAGCAVAAAIGSMVLIYQTGLSGARSAWAS
jgi:hypothetical protein